MATSNGDLLNILQASARSGTLLSSCEPEVKELMHQLDILLSSQHTKHEGDIARLTAMVKDKEANIQQLHQSLREKMAEIEHLRHEAVKREREYQVRSADCEAQLVRLRSEVSHISQSYEQLKEKRYRGQRSHKKGPEVRHELKLEEPKKEKERVQELEAERTRRYHQNSQVTAQQGISRNSHEEEFASELTDKILEDFSSHVHVENSDDDHQYIPLQPAGAQETSQLLEEILEQHFQQLNSELLKVFDVHVHL